MMRSLMVVLLLSLSLHAQPLPDPVLNAAQRREVAELFAARIDQSYILVDEAKKMSAAIREHIRRGDYDRIESATEFAAKVTADARAINDDKHLRLGVAKQILPDVSSEAREKRDAPLMAESARRQNYGLAAAQRLAGNIGYLDVEFFPPVELAAPTYDAAMAFLANTDALIIDARRHRGGEPATVAYLVSHFVPAGTLINTIYNRERADPELYRASKVAKIYSKPVYVLTSRRTFSGGEELAYDLQSLGRAKLYGEVTGGGAHPTAGFRLTDRFTASIPIARSVNPITKTNWESVGVKPDVPVDAADALRAAHLAALEQLASAASGEWRNQLQAEAAKLKPETAAPAAAAAGANPRASLDAWLKSFNEHDTAAREAWLKANTNQSEESAKKYASLDVQIREEHGPFELVRVVKTTETSIEAEAKHTKSGAVAIVKIQLDPNKPERIANVGLALAE